MSGMLSKMVLLMQVATVTAVLVAVSGCANSVATDTLRIETVREIFPTATDISRISISRDVQKSGRTGSHNISEIRGSSGLLGYCVESELVSRSGPFMIRVFLDKQLIVKQANVISYPWQRGRNVRRWEFTNQFEGKGLEDAIEIGKDIDAMTGATISSRVMADGVREAVKLLKRIMVGGAHPAD